MIAKRIRQAFWLPLLVSLLFLFGALVLFVKGDYQWRDMTSLPCRITKSQDVSSCQKKTRYVEIVTKGVYSTRHTLEENGKTVAHFVDIDLSGYSLVALVDPETAAVLFEKTAAKEPMTVAGRLETFDGAKKEAYQSIQDDYVETFSSSSTKEEVLSRFLPVQFLSYQGSYEGMRNTVLLLFFVFVLALWYAIRSLVYLIAPTRLSFFRKKGVTKQEISIFVPLEPPFPMGRFTVLTERFLGHALFGFSGIWWEDVLWIRPVLKKDRTRLVFYTARHRFSFSLPSSDALTFLQDFQEKKPSLLVGEKKECNKEYQKRRKQTDENVV